MNELLEMVQSVEMDESNNKQELLFDITDFKTEKEVKYSLKIMLK